jgi:hypothetical protein
MTQATAVGVTVTSLTGVIVIAYAAYYVRYVIKHGPAARTPLEAWITARRERKTLDRELERVNTEG